MPTVDVLSYILQLDSKGFQAGAAQAEQRINTLASTITSQLKMAVVGLAGAYLGAQGLRAAFNWTVTAAAEEEAALKRLSISVDNIGQSWVDARPEIEQVINRLRALTAFSDDEMIPALQVLIDQTGDYQRALKLLPNALDLATSRQMPLAEAAGMLGRVTEENIMRMGRLFPRLKEQAEAFAKLHPEVEKGAYFLELVNKQTAGQAAAELETYAGKVKNLKDEFSQLGEIVGNFWIPILDKMLSKMTGAKDKTDIAQIIRDQLDAVEKELARVRAKGPLGYGSGTEILAQLTGQADELMKFAFERYNAEIDRLTAKAKLLKEALEIEDPWKEREKIERQRTQSEQEQLTFFEKRVAYEELYYSLKLRTSEQMIAFYKKEMAAFQENAKIKEAGLKRLSQLELDIERRYAEIEARGMRLQGGTRAIPLHGGGLVEAEPYRGGGYQIGYEDQISIWDQMWNEIEVISSEGKDLLLGIFEGLMGQLDSTFRDIADTFISALKGDWASVGSGLVNIIASIFGGVEDEIDQAAAMAEKAQRVGALLYQLRNDLLDYMDAFTGVTEIMLEQERQRMSEIVDLMGEWTDILQAPGPVTPEQQARIDEIIAQLAALGVPYERLQELAEAGVDILDYYTDKLNQLNNIFSDEAAIRAIDNYSEAMDYLNNAQNLNYRKGVSLIDYWSEMFNLTVEEQIALWQEFLENLEASGELTLEQRHNIERTIKDLRDQEAQRAESQIYRSVTMITERQANSMLAVLNTIRAVLQEISNKISQAMSDITLPRLGPGKGGGIGPIYINADSTTTGVRVAREFVRELRSRGVQVSL
jgi:hypothetical protein